MAQFQLCVVNLKQNKIHIGQSYKIKKKNTTTSRVKCNGAFMASVFNVRNLVSFNSVCLQLFHYDITRSVCTLDIAIVNAYQITSTLHSQ